jgi:hypothetical protein
VNAVLVLILLAAPFLQAAPATNLPDPPVGFAWQEIPELKAALLRPNGWFFKREETKGTLAYFITKESIDNGGEFQTGLTVNAFRHKKDNAVESAKNFIDQIATKKHGEKWAKEAGPFKEFGCLTRDTDATGTTVTQTLMVANPKTNTLYLLIFESPAPTWDSAWKLGQTIFDSLALDDEI